MYDYCDVAVDVWGEFAMFTEPFAKVERETYLGTRECMCHFAPPDYNKKSINLTCRLGVMLYDVFDIDNKLPLDTRPYSVKHGLTCDVAIRYFELCFRKGACIEFSVNLC